MRKLPIGIQTFTDIRKDNYFYVDKTQEAYELITHYRYVFLSRPRRFGKSLFVDTLKCIFEGKKELFEGLYIYDKWNWKETYPVVHISLSGDFRNSGNIESRINKILRSNREKLKIDNIQSDSYVNYFEELIENIYEKYQKKIVILVDEYDKPILDNIEDLERANQIRETLKSLYTVIKDMDQYIHFAFFTGVTKFVKAGIFIGLNMLYDITLDENYGNICGYIQKDVEGLLSEYNANVDLAEVKEWYNGYYWLKERVYNPFDILNFVAKGFKFKNYWFLSGTPTFLIKLLGGNNFFLPRLSNIQIKDDLLDSYNIENLDLIVLLFQAGYLTIKEEKITNLGISYKLCFPNKEVRSSFNIFILDELKKDKEATANSERLSEAIESGNLEAIRDAFIAIFSSIPYNNYVNNKIYEYEGYYSTVIYLYLQAMGYEIIGEDVTNLGRIDLTFFHKNAIYLFEFKVEKGKDALEQLKAKNYHEKYINDERPIYLVGINFDKEVKNISGFQYERVNK